QTAVRLPATVWPEQLAIAGDGSLWMADKYLGLARRGADGRVHSFGLGDDDAVSDVVRGPDGAIWFAMFDKIGRIDRAGKLRTRNLGSPAFLRAATTADAAVWFAGDGPPGRIWHVTVPGTATKLTFRGLRAGAEIDGIAPGRDGALWFTQTMYADGPDGIGRLTTDGSYRTWPLRKNAGPLRILAGPDGSLWFTEQEAAAVGRITTSGEIREFPLRGLAPSGIVDGPGGALWFTAESCLGSITTAGNLATWAIRGAKTLEG